MDDSSDRDWLRVNRELATLQERFASLEKHKAGADEMHEIERDYRQADFRTLQEISGQISALRTDMREWTHNSIDATETRLMAALKSNSAWQRQIPIYIAIGLGLVTVLSGNTGFLKLLGIGGGL